MSSKRAVIVLVGCVFGIGLVLFGFWASSKSRGKQASTEENTVAESQRTRTIRPWNMALGNVVVVAQELGFGVTGAENASPEPNRITARIESQLQNLRELYRQESEKNSTLMGGMMLQLTVGSSGEVTQVKEIASRITDGEFKKAVVAEVSNWSFQELVNENATINCPLLFVREGMDITTLVQWEKSLGPLADKAALARSNALPVQQSKAHESAKPTANRIKAVAAAAEKPAPVPPVITALDVYQIKHPTALRKEPNFASSSSSKITIGTKVALIGRHGDWLEVKAEDSGLSGFIRKEFAAPLELAKKQ